MLSNEMMQLLRVEPVIDSDKNRVNVPKLEVADLVLLNCNIAYYTHQQKK